MDLAQQLRHAVTLGSAADLQRVLAGGAAADERLDAGQTALMLAAAAGRIEAARLLLDAGADPNAEDPNGITPVLRAAAGGHAQLLQLLLDRGGSTHVRRLGRTALSALACEISADIAEVLLRAGTDANAGEALLNAASGGNADLVRLLLERGADVNAVNEHGETALHVALQDYHEAPARFSEVVHRLLDAGADVNRQTSLMTPLGMAGARGGAELVRLLIAHGADPNVLDARGQTPLCEAIRLMAMEGPEVVSALIERGADVNFADGEGRTPLAVAVETSGEAAIGPLLEAGADIGRLDSRLQLLLAIQRDDLASASAQLGAGTDPDARNELGETALMLAAMRGSPEMAGLLLHAGARVYSPGEPQSGGNALHAAIAGGHHQVVRLLLAAGADPDGVAGGEKQLWWAAAWGNSEAVRALLEAGVDPRATGDEGSTAAEVARRQGHAFVAALLDEYAVPPDESPPPPER